MRSFLLGCLLSAPLSFAVAAGPDVAEDPWALLQHAAHAARDLSYKGVFIYQSGSNARSVQITHMNYGQGEYSRTIVLDGLPREVLSQGKDMVIFSPRNEKVVIEKRRGQNLFPALLPADMDVIRVSYQARVGGTERVGGREGQIVFLDPRDAFRYGYKFWADREYGLLLKALTINEHNEVMEQIAFNQLALLDTQNMDWFQPNVDHAKPYVMEDAAQAAPVPDIGNLVLAQLPPGYRKIDQARRMVPGKPAPVTHLIFSDGLASVSLFVEPLAKGARAKVGHTVVGPTNLYANVVDNYQVVAVGEVPESTVTQIANAVSFKK